MLVSVGLGLAVLAEAVGLPGAPRALVAAHRGGALLWPENSLTAFRQALALGVDYLETDIHLTADGEVVILHDPTLDRTTTGRGESTPRGLPTWPHCTCATVAGRSRGMAFPLSASSSSSWPRAAHNSSWRSRSTRIASVTRASKSGC